MANLPPGDWDVAFFSGCFGPSNAAQLLWFKGQAGADKAGLVNLRAGSEVSGINAVVSRAGSIAGTVTSTAGQAVDFDCVTAFNRRTGQQSGFQALFGDGSFDISSLAPGSYTVVAADCIAGDNLAASVYPRAVTVQAGRTTGKVGLRLPRGGVVTGRITAASGGRPVPRACVQAVAAGAGAAAFGIGSGTLTGRLGRYTIVGLRTGSYRIVVYPNCAVPAVGGAVKGNSAVNLQTVTLAHPVRVAEGRVAAGVDAALPTGGSIAGQVSGPGAAAVPGACAAAQPADGGQAVSATADAHGGYAITGLTPGRYTVEFGDPSCSDDAAGLGIQWYRGAAGSGAPTVITVTAGQTAGGIDGVLPADGTITGSVTGSAGAGSAGAGLAGAGLAGAGLAGVCVSAVPLANGEQASFTVSAAGSYTLADLQPGRYKVKFQAGCGQAGVGTQWWRDAASGAAATIITVTAGGTVSGIDATMARGVRSPS